MPVSQRGIRVATLLALAALPLAAQDVARDGALSVLRAAQREGDRFVILFTGDGWTESDLQPGGAFPALARACSLELLLSDPFRDVLPWIEVRTLAVASREHGCDPTPDADEIDTAFDARFDGRLIRLVGREALAASLEPMPDVDLVCVFVASERVAGSGDRLVTGHGGVPMPIVAGLQPDVMHALLHEIGHSLGGLADEYADDETALEHPLPPDGEPIRKPNAQLVRDIVWTDRGPLPGSLRWRHFLDLPGADAHAWRHDGAHYRASGVVRPWATCLMRDGDQPFCPVCLESVARALHAACDAEWDDAAHHARHPLSAWTNDAPATPVPDTHAGPASDG